MVIKVLFIVLAFFAYQVHGSKEIRLKDVDVNLIRSESMGSPLTIPRQFEDILLTCYITYPNGRRFEAFPENNLPDVNLFLDYVQQPYTECTFGFKNASSEFSGTYELESIIASSLHQFVTLIKQRFHVNITEP